MKDDGYTTRRISKGLDNIRVTFNGILLADNKTIMGL